MLILDLWGVSFHAVIVFGLGKNLLFKSILGRCDSEDGKKSVESYEEKHQEDIGAKQS